MSTPKNLVIEGKNFTQADKTDWTRAASLSGKTLNEWVVDTLRRHGAYRQSKPVDTWQPPAWCEGMTYRLADCLVNRAGYTSREQVQAAWDSQPYAGFFKIENFGTKCLVELEQWLKNGE